MSAEILALLDSDPAAGILAVADLRETRASNVAPGPWGVFNQNEGTEYSPLWYVANDIFHNPPPDDDDRTPWLAVELHTGSRLETEHIAAEANPAHALAAVRRWRGVVERHVRSVAHLDPPYGFCRECQARWASPGATTAWPCPDVRETADEARAYLGGSV